MVWRPITDARRESARTLCVRSTAAGRAAAAATAVTGPAALTEAGQRSKGRAGSRPRDQNRLGALADGFPLPEMNRAAAVSHSVNPPQMVCLD